jgi:hypothetical protein
VNCGDSIAFGDESTSLLVLSGVEWATAARDPHDDAQASAVVSVVGRRRLNAALANTTSQSIAVPGVNQVQESERPQPNVDASTT